MLPAAAVSTSSVAPAMRPRRTFDGRGVGGVFAVVTMTPFRSRFVLVAWIEHPVAGPLGPRWRPRWIPVGAVQSPFRPTGPNEVPAGAATGTQRGRQRGQPRPVTGLARGRGRRPRGGTCAG